MTDIVVETEGKLVPVEVKLSATPRPAMASGTISTGEFLEKELEELRSKPRGSELVSVQAGLCVNQEGLESLLTAREGIEYHRKCRLS